MTCEEILAALNDYVDGRRDTAICEALEKHLADCNPCRLVVDNIRQTIRLYKSGRLVELPARKVGPIMGWKGTLFLLGVLVVWFVLNRWVLPRCGISTCCCPAVPPSQTISDPVLPPADAAPGQNVEDQKGELP